MSYVARQTRRTALSRIITAVGFFCCSAFAAPASAETVDISVPLTVTFQVTNVSAATTGSATVSFSNSSLLPLHVVRILVRADAVEFVGPSGNKVPASAVSWTASNAQGGVGWGGTLSSSTDVLVFQSGLLPSSGRVELTFSLQPLADVHAGTHSVNLRWTIESALP